MTVFDKINPRAEGEPSRPHGWRAAAGTVTCVVAALVATRAGASDLAVGIWLALSVPAVLAWLIYVWAPDRRTRRSLRGAVVAATYFTSSATALASIVPGFELGQATLRSPGDEMTVATVEGGTTRIAVSGAMPRERPGHVTYELRAGDERIFGAVERTRSHIRIGRTEQHRSSEHGAHVYTVALPPGRTRIVLVHLGGELVDGLRIAIFDPVGPTWLPASCAVLAFIVVVWLLASGRAAASVAMAAGICVAFGLAMSAIATPHRPFRGSVLALVAAVPLGVVGGFLGLAVIQRVKRARERLRLPPRGRRRPGTSV
jgi:hypothetical protein